MTRGYLESPLPSPLTGIYGPRGSVSVSDSLRNWIEASRPGPEPSEVRLCQCHTLARFPLVISC